MPIPKRQDLAQVSRMSTATSSWRHVAFDMLENRVSRLPGSRLINRFIVLLIVANGVAVVLESNAELPGHFDNIAQAIWWAVVTLTTVGYGDVVPLTFGGKLLGIAIMLLGVGTMALPAGILAARFSEELHQRREVLVGRVREALADGTLDPDEQLSLQRLQEDLAIPEGDLARIVRAQQGWMARHRFCPHCGGSLDPRA